jgi:hypothetical protein
LREDARVPGGVEQLKALAEEAGGREEERERERRRKADQEAAEAAREAAA